MLISGVRIDQPGSRICFNGLGLCGWNVLRLVTVNYLVIKRRAVSVEQRSENKKCSTCLARSWLTNLSNILI